MGGIPDLYSLLGVLEDLVKSIQDASGDNRTALNKIYEIASELESRIRVIRGALAGSVPPFVSAASRETPAAMAFQAATDSPVTSDTDEFVIRVDALDIPEEVSNSSVESNTDDFLIYEDGEV